MTEFDKAIIDVLVHSDGTPQEDLQAATRYYVGHARETASHAERINDNEAATILRDAATVAEAALPLVASVDTDTAALVCICITIGVMTIDQFLETLCDVALSIVAESN